LLAYFLYLGNIPANLGFLVMFAFSPDPLPSAWIDKEFFWGEDGEFKSNLGDVLQSYTRAKHKWFPVLK
jgi:hypothetical protein